MADIRDQAAPGAASAGQVRRLTPADWPALRQVRLEALAEAPYAFSSTLEREQGFDERAWRDRITSAATFMAWQDGRPAGIAAGISEQSARAAGHEDAAAGTAHLVSMWVSPQARGCGLADSLVAAVCDWACEQEAARVELWVTDVNARARRFYQRLGFASTGRRQLVRPQEPGHWEELLVRPLR